MQFLQKFIVFSIKFFVKDIHAFSEVVIFTCPMMLEQHLKVLSNDLSWCGVFWSVYYNDGFLSHRLKHISSDEDLETLQSLLLPAVCQCIGMLLLFITFLV